MICQFPHEVAYLARTKLSYVNLPRLLNDGKRDRAARVFGFVAIYLGDFCYLIFLREGEPFHAVRISPSDRKPVSIAEVLRRVALEIEHGENGTIGYYGAPEAQLRTMLATLLYPALAREQRPNLAHPDDFFPALQEQHFSGIVELTDARGLHYLCFENGEYGCGFFSGRHPSVPLADFVETIFGSASADDGIRLFAPAAGMPEQAPPGLLNLYRRQIQRIMHELVGQLGADAAAELLNAGRISAQRLHPVVGVFGLRNGGWVLEDGVVSPEELTSGVGAWLTEVLAAASDRTGRDPTEILTRTARDDRFVLEERGFFDRLPWPVVF